MRSYRFATIQFEFIQSVGFFVCAPARQYLICVLYDERKTQSVSHSYGAENRYVGLDGLARVLKFFFCSNQEQKLKNSPSHLTIPNTDSFIRVNNVCGNVLRAFIVNYNEPNHCNGFLLLVFFSSLFLFFTHSDFVWVL